MPKPYGDCGVMVARQIVALVVMVRIHTFPPLDQRYALTFLKKYDIINIQKRKIRNFNRCYETEYLEVLRNSVLILLEQ